MAESTKALFTGGANVNPTLDQRNFYVDPQNIKKKWANITPVLTSLANFEMRRGLKDPMFKMFEYTFKTKQCFKVTNGVTTTGDTEAQLTVTGTGAIGLPTTLTNYLVNKQCVVVADKDGAPAGAVKGNILITTFTSSTVIKVKRLGTADFVIADNDWLFIINSDFGAGAYAANPSYDTIRTVWNQCGESKTSFQVVKDIYYAYLRGESNEYLRLKEVADRDHKRENELKILYSRSTTGTNLNTGDTFVDGQTTDADGNVVRPTYGLLTAILDFGSSTVGSRERNIYEINRATFDYKALEEMTENLFYGIPDGVMPFYVPSSIMSFFNTIQGTYGSGIAGNSKWSVQTAPNKLPSMGNSTMSRMGFNVREWETSNGVIQLVKCSTMTDSPYPNTGVAIDPDNAFLAEYGEGAMFEEDILKDNRPTLIKSQFSSQLGVGLTNISQHKAITLV